MQKTTDGNLEAEVNSWEREGNPADADSWQQQGIKFDQEKPMMALLSPWWIEGVSAVLTYGAKKYAADNWRDGLSIRRLLSACLRHVFAFIRGEDNDPETGLSHLLHASCCLMFAFETQLLRRKFDDRWKQPNKVDKKTA